MVFLVFTKNGQWTASRQWKIPRQANGMFGFASNSHASHAIRVLEKHDSLYVLL
jgi:hypothetical protein